MLAETICKPHDCCAAAAPQLLDWLKTRGGLALWRTMDLALWRTMDLALWRTMDLRVTGRSWTCPMNDDRGNVKGRPYHDSETAPYRTITSTDDVLVSVDREVKRFHIGLHIGLRMGSQGLCVKLTDGATRRVNAAVEKAGLGAYHLFDYGVQDAVIMAPIPGHTVTLTDWAKAKGL